MINVVVVGTGGSGKSALCVRFVNGTFVERYDPTIEDTYRKQVEFDGHATMVAITDTAGQEQYMEATQMSLALASCIMVAVASDNRTSLQKASTFVRLARDARTTPSLSTSVLHPPIMVVRTKSDVTRWTVSEDDLNQLRHEHELTTRVMATSALTDDGVHEAFLEAIRLATDYTRQAYALESSRTNNSGVGRSRRNSLTASLLTAASALRNSGSSSSSTPHPFTAPSSASSSASSSPTRDLHASHSAPALHASSAAPLSASSSSSFDATTRRGGGGGSGCSIL